ncbi:MAG: response regulator [Taibaiella sp.]|nr:response regulator [Taibaiella sp.]
MSENFRFVLVDDVSVNNLLVGRIIQKLLPGASVSQFTDGGQAFEFLKDMDDADREHGKPLVVLLDIYMPTMDGWAFLDSWQELSEVKKRGVQLWILSSSISPADRERARSSSLIAGYLSKPFTAESINTIVQHLGAQVA